MARVANYFAELPYRNSALATLIALNMSVITVAQAEDTPSYRETQLGLYVKAYDLLQQEDDALLIDVRDPVEIKFTGFAEPTDIHVPWVLTDTTQFDADSKTWPTVRNVNFAEQIRAALEAHQTKDDTPIIVMCRSGATRSAPAADLITEMGFSQVYSVSDGFEGGRLLKVTQKV